MLIAVILAAGKGERAKLGIPKQFYHINGKSILKIATERFENCQLIDSILIVAHPDYIEETRFEVRKLDKVMDVIIGGKTRQESAYRALLYLKKFSPDYVLIHDVARPFVHVKDIIAVIKKAQETNCGAILVEKENYTVSEGLEDTMKRLISRDKIFRHLTPQVFRYTRLLNAYDLFKDELKSFTDDASIYFTAGYTVKYVISKFPNVKITEKYDVEILKAILNSQNFHEKY